MRKHRLFPRFRIKTLSNFGFLSLFGLLVFFIFQTNMMTEETYRLQDYQQRVEKISKENAELEIALSQANSLANIDEKIVALNFEKATKIVYIRVFEGEMARK